MKLLRRIFCLLVLSVFFLFGVTVADRQRLNQNVLGICITADSKATADEVFDYVDGLQYGNVQMLCGLINESAIATAAPAGKQFFEAGVCDGGAVPAGVYDTVHIKSGSNTAVYKYLLGGKITFSDKVPAARLQNVYVTVLSLAGGVDRFILELQK